MQKLNQYSTKIFCRLLHKLKGQRHMKLQASEFMPLTMEKLDENIQTPYGKGTLYSLCHYYEQNGDLMRDPEMCFLAIDNRTHENDFDLISIYPQMYQQDNLGLYEECICIDSGKVTSYIKVWQSGHCQFANQWLKNISQQGFLK